MNGTMPGKKRPAKTAEPCPPMSGGQLRELRAAAGLEQTDAAELLCVPVATYRNWEQGRRRIPGPAARLARLTFPK